ncbi:MAG: glutamate dehydrogenase, partial [Candidatus Cloacimonetes bacterium]|nr:glutamate dehydrogenase [Candidatus Cloacimonadota bacterium]
GVLTGKGLGWGGSLIRPEATGYGVAYFLQEMLATRGQSLEGKTITMSGYGNVGTYFVEKVNELGGKVVSLGDEYGCVHDPDGISGDKLKFMSTLWSVYRKSAREYATEFGVKWIDGGRPWQIPCDIAVPSATQNELNAEDARTLIQNGCLAVVEAANMPSTPEAVDLILEKGLLFA